MKRKTKDVAIMVDNYTKVITCNCNEAARIIGCHYTTLRKHSIAFEKGDAESTKKIRDYTIYFDYDHIKKRRTKNKSNGS